ncbi:hypothetical protein [Kitasatospora cineracea]|uniref:Uncharacterized protein n=1 Tax=Kitasatospora cineracea TaxID=88074 RepID=A0A3N4RV71_9ACTN|nr:hypothetical protein [Kitasatospora cineracea]RPE34959.1 hypothetical protein EDD38_3302 [Kitasatospora cineracea]
MTTQPLDTAAIQARQHLVLDADACGTCRRNVANGQPTEHEQCNRRAMLVPAPDQPDYEQILDTPEDQRANLPARFHVPVFESNAEPNSWLCAVCWGDGWATRWPCTTATEQGREVFTAEHHGERARWDGARLLARVAELTADLDEMTRCRAAALRALHRDDIPTDIDVEDTIANSLWGPGWDWEDERTPRLIARDVAPAIRPALAKTAEQRDQALARVAELEAKRTALEAACDGLAEAGRNESRIWAARVAELERQLTIHQIALAAAPTAAPGAR